MFEVMNIVSSPKKRKVAAGKTTPAGRVTGKTTTVFVHQPQHFNFGAKGAIVVHNYTVRSEGYIYR